jgi:uncharacterized protein (DUF2267 family)
MSDQHVFDTFHHEANEYLNTLCERLGHPDEHRRVLNVWRAVVHTIRDRITPQEAFHMMSQLPTLMKGVFVENWTYSTKPIEDFRSLDEMTRRVEERQRQLGETEFDWDASTREIISEVARSLKDYLSPGQYDHILENLPKEVSEVM